MNSITWLMNVVDGLSECAPLSSTCVFDWAAAGGWAGAIATFLAVLLPFYREKKRARLRHVLTLGSYKRSLETLSRRLDTVSSIRSTLGVGTYEPKREEFELFIQIDFEFPVLEIEPELERVILASGWLREALEQWRRATQSLLIALPERVSAARVEAVSPLLDTLNDLIQDSLMDVESEVDRALFRLGASRNRHPKVRQ